MNLHQFRFVQEAARRNLNLTETAKALHTSQPGVSKAIIELEEELGIEIFARHGKRLKRITEPGQHVLHSIEQILREVGNLKKIGEQYSAQDSGTLSIATTHTQARYVLPVPVAKLREKYPKVNISLHQGAPDQVAKMLLDDTAEIGIATESCPATNGNTCWCCRSTIPWPAKVTSRSKTSPTNRSSLTTLLSQVAAALTKPLPPKKSPPALLWKPSTRT